MSQGKNKTRQATMRVDGGQLLFSGQVKYTRGLSGGPNCNRYRSGWIGLSKKGSSWLLEVHLDVEKVGNAVLAVSLTPDSVDRCSFGEGFFLIKVFHPPSSKDTVTIYFKPSNKSVIKTLKNLSPEFTQPSSHVSVNKSEVSLSSSSITTPSRKTLFTTVGNTPDSSRKDGRTENKNQSPQQRFTSVKENTRHDFDDIDGDFKENMTSTPDGSRNKFLQQAMDKSRESMSTLGTKKFYSGSNLQYTPSNGSGWLNSSKRPGMMPDPTPNKRPRLSHSVPYSMKAKIAAQDPKPQQTLQGFSNLGNTCYMNAILQSLFGLDPLAADLLTTNRKLLKTVSPQSLYYALAKLLNSRKQNLSDISRREMLRKVKSAISVSAKRFSGYGQHDAHEFLGQVLDQLKEEVVKINKGTPSPVREPLSENNQPDRDFINPATINFEFEVMHSITCLDCREEVCKEEQFHDVSVDLPKKKDASTPRSLQDSLSIFFRKEEIEYTCEKCGHNKSEVTHKFTRLPRVFIVHLKRYSYDQTYLKNTKMAQSVTIPTYLTLQEHCEENTQPAHPVLMAHVNHSEEKALAIFDNKEETPKRKLDFPRFNKKGLTPSSTANGNSTAPETGNQDKDKSQNETEPLIPLTLEDEQDSELAKAIEMSLKEEEEREKRTREYGNIGEDSWQKVLEMSEHEDKHSPTDKCTNGKELDNLSEDQLIQLAIEQSLLETDSQHHSNFTYNDEPMKPSDHDYVDSYDIGPEMEDLPDLESETKQTIKIEHNSETSQQIQANRYKQLSDLNSVTKTAKTSDTVKVCSEAVLSSSTSERGVSPGVFSDFESDSETLELYLEPDEPEQHTKLEDKTDSLSKDKNNNFKPNEDFDPKMFYTLKGKAGRVCIYPTDGQKSDKDCSLKLPGGMKKAASEFQDEVGHTDGSVTGSSDTDDFELIIETESEYDNSVGKWNTNSVKSYDKSDKLKDNGVGKWNTNSVKSYDKSDKLKDNSVGKWNTNSVNKSYDKSDKLKDNSEWLRIKKEDSENKADKIGPLEDNRVDSKGDSVKVETTDSHDFNGSKKLDDSGDSIEAGSKVSGDSVEAASKFLGDSFEAGSKVNSNGQYIRKCQLSTVMKGAEIDENKENVIELSSEDCESNESVKNDSFLTDSLFSQSVKTSLKETGCSTLKSVTPNRKRYGQRLEDLGKKMNDDSDSVLGLMKDKESSANNLTNTNEKKSDNKEAGGKAFGEDDIDFFCLEDDSWVQALDDKENKLPSKRPVLTDPSKEFGESKVAKIDEVDGFIDASLDIPEINNEKGELPYSYRLVSVVSHMGMSSSVGHYISDVYDMTKRSWFSFDDSHVSKITESEVKAKRERNGYIFFYMNKDIFDDVCLQHAVKTTDRRKDT